MGELIFGAIKRNWGKAKMEDQQARLKAVVIVPYDIEICRTYARLRARLESDGTPIADNDLWIASCAVRHSIPLISNNRDHFDRIKELQLISEAPRKGQDVLELGEATSSS